MPGRLRLFADWVSNHGEEYHVALVALERGAVSTRNAVAPHDLLAKLVEEHTIDEGGLLASDQRNDPNGAPPILGFHARKARIGDEFSDLFDDYLGLAPAWCTDRLAGA